MKPSEAIENIEYARRWMGCESDFSEEALDMAIFALKKLEKDRWIPVTESLPEEDCDCRVTVKNGFGIHVFDCSYNKGKKRFESWYPYQDDFMPIRDVTAWKPIEAPYQEDKA